MGGEEPVPTRGFHAMPALCSIMLEMRPLPLCPLPLCRPCPSCSPRGFHELPGLPSCPLPT